jgi:hypothetical protein
LEFWYAAKLMAGMLRPTTARCYRQHLDAYLLPQLGGLRLCRLRGWDVTRMYAQIRSERDAAPVSSNRCSRQRNSRPRPPTPPHHQDDRETLDRVH